jgi:hypothetical protein
MCGTFDRICVFSTKYWQVLEKLKDTKVDGHNMSKLKRTNYDLQYVCFVDRCLSFCTFFFWPLCCLFFFDIRIMIAPLVSSNSFYNTLHRKLVSFNFSSTCQYFVENTHIRSNVPHICQAECKRNIHWPLLIFLINGHLISDLKVLMVL